MRIHLKLNAIAIPSLINYFVKIGCYIIGYLKKYGLYEKS